MTKIVEVYYFSEPVIVCQGWFHLVVVMNHTFESSHCYMLLSLFPCLFENFKNDNRDIHRQEEQSGPRTHTMHIATVRIIVTTLSINEMSFIKIINVLSGLDVNDVLQSSI